jgi:hypothetical protein
VRAYAMFDPKMLSVRSEIPSEEGLEEESEILRGENAEFWWERSV